MDNRVGVQVAVIRRGSVVLTCAVGLATRSPERATTPTTTFALNSITKTFTALDALVLASNGELDLDRPVRAYLPYASRMKFSVRDALQHRSGLLEYNTDAFRQAVSTGCWRCAGPALRHHALLRLDAEYDPRRMGAYQYSNSNYLAIGAVIESVTRGTYRASLQRNVARNLERTFIRGHYPAEGYYDDGYELEPTVSVADDWSFSAGELWSNAMSLAQWDDALLSGHVVSAAIAESWFRDTKAGSGSGLFYRRMGNDDIYWHEGGSLGFSAINVLDPGSKTSIVVLSNANSVDVFQLAAAARSVAAQ